MGVLRIHGGFRGQLQGADKGRLQFRQEVQGTAQEGHGAPDGLAAGKAGNGLIHHRLENGNRQIGLGGALVDERLDVGFGEHAAPGGDGIHPLIMLRRLIQAGGVGLQKRGHLVDEGAGAAGANAVHPFLQAALEINDLGILAAQLDGHVRLRGCGFQGSGHRHHLLDKADIQGFPQIDGSGTGDAQTQTAVAQLPLCRHQKGFQGFLGMGMMTAVLSKQERTVVIQNHKLYSGRTDINTGAIGIHDLPLFSVA